MSKSQLDQRLGTVLRKKTTGDIGIEVELEGILYNADQTKYWSSKEEGSLRHGVEYVLIRPVYMKELDDALSEFGGYMSKSQPKRSIRCSTHMHVNVIDKTIRQIYAIIAYYYMIEDILVSTQGPIRTGNLFCLRMSDAEGLSESITYSIKDEMFFKAFNLGHHKYSACNLASVGRFGSLEFRFLRPLTDLSMLRKWAWLFYNMIENASALTVKQVIEAAISKNAYDFLKMVFNKDQIELITQGRPEYELAAMMVNNFDHVSKMSHHLNRKRKFYIPDEFLDDDLSGSPYRVSQKFAIDPSTVGDVENGFAEPQIAPEGHAAMPPGVPGGFVTPELTFELDPD